MDRIYITEEIITMKDGTIAKALTEKANKNEALSTFHQIMASAIINSDVLMAYAEVKDNYGEIYIRDTWVRDNGTVVKEIPSEEK